MLRHKKTCLANIEIRIERKERKKQIDFKTQRRLLLTEFKNLNIREAESHIYKISDKEIQAKLKKQLRVIEKDYDFGKFLLFLT